MPPIIADPDLCKLPTSEASREVNGRLSAGKERSISREGGCTCIASHDIDDVTAFLDHEPNNKPDVVLTPGSDQSSTR